MGVSEPSTGPPSGQQAAAGRFRLGRALGDAAGGCFAGADVDGTPVTIEFIDGGDDPEGRVARLKSDPAFSSALEGAHMVPVLDVGVYTGTSRLFIALPAYDGTDARRLIAKQGPVDPQSAVRVILQACRGVMEFQGAGARLAEVRASDLWLVNGPDGEVTVRVAPVSSARSTPLDLNGLSGTDVVPLRSFVAPERRSAPESQDERSTVWSLGACLYWLLSGSSPGAESSVADGIVSVQDLAPWVSPGLTIALHLALQADPAQRWPSVEAFANSLEPHAGDGEHLGAASLAPIDRNVRRRISDRADPEALCNPALDGMSSVTDTASSTGLFGKSRHEPARLATLIGNTLMGRWKLLRVIGRGGMGAVFEVEGPDGSHAAAKLIDRRHVAEDEEQYKRFFREAKAASLIDSPHVVRTIEAGVDPELKAPFIIMELLRGVDLKSVLRERGALDAQPAVRIFLQAARGIADAHLQHVIHRDIKPANLFLHEEPDGHVIVKVCDFGIAKHTGEDVDGDQTGSHELTRTGSMLGSPLYMSPEQASNARKVDHRTDIWSLCISLYEALSGTKPWAGRSALGEIIVALCTQPVRPLHRAAPWVNRQLAEVVHRGLRLDLAERYATVDEFIAALEPFAGASEDFTSADLQPVSPELRAMKASSMPPPPTDEDSATVMGGALSLGSGSDTAASRPDEPERRSHKTSITLGLVATAAIAVATTVLVRTRHAPQPAPAAASTRLTLPARSATAPQAPLSHARVKIVPQQAQVTVNGHPVQVLGGYIMLNGLPGTAFNVVATLASGAKKSGSVMLAREGGAVPDAIVIEPARTLRVSAHRRQRAPPKAIPSASPKKHVTAPPKPTSEPKQPQFKTEW